jgi:hypothetical protein
MLKASFNYKIKGKDQETPILPYFKKQNLHL